MNHNPQHEFHRSSYNMQEEESAMFYKFNSPLITSNDEIYGGKYPWKAEKTQQREQRRLNTDNSQLYPFDSGFKKMKNNQVEALKELKQEYEILRNLPIQEHSMPQMTENSKRASMYSCSQNENMSSLSSSKQSSKLSSKQSSKNHHRSSSHLHSVQKKQLELIISNSMKKIEELLFNETKYKKVIHQMELQLDENKYQEKFQELTKTIKKNELDLINVRENHKQQRQELQQNCVKLQEKIAKLEGQLALKGQQTRELFEERKRNEEKKRLERDRYAQLEIECRRIKMEAEMMEKDKQNQIYRLQKMLHQQPRYDQNAYLVKKMEEDLREKERKYEQVHNQFERYKADSQKMLKQKLSENQSQNQEHGRLLQAYLSHLKYESAQQNNLSNQLFTTIINKLEEKKNTKPTHQNQSLLAEIEHLRHQLALLREERNEKEGRDLEQLPIFEMEQYVDKINQLQQEIEDGSITKENLMEEYRILKSSYEYLQEELGKANEENTFLKERLARASDSGSNVQGELKLRIRQKQDAYEQQIRQLRRKNDELAFLVEKTKEQAQLNINLAEGKHTAEINQLKNQLIHQEQTKNSLKTELHKMRSFYENKQEQKNAIIQKLQEENLNMRQGGEEKRHEEKKYYDQQLQNLVHRLEESKMLNDRSAQISSRNAILEKEIHELKGAFRGFRAMNDAVDHLWNVKETEYENVNYLLQAINQ